MKAAIEAARLGGKLALTYFHKHLKGKKKADESIITIADATVEKALKKYLLQQFPEIGFVGEETESVENKDTFWIIDPIDSTREFTRGTPSWSINIALWQDGEIRLGVVYYPPLDTLLIAEHGKGAYYNNHKIAVSMTDKLNDTMIGHQSLKRFTKTKELLALLKKGVIPRGYESNQACLHVALGHIDVAMLSYGNMWDYAPFKVIIEEAGGKTTNLEGKPWTLKDATFLATNGILHDTIVKGIMKK